MRRITRLTGGDRRGSAKDAMIEADLHRRFRHLHVNGEWFHWTDELHEYVNALCNEECYL